MTDLKLAVVLFAVQCVQYFMLTINFRAIAQGRYIWMASTDLLIAGFGFFVIKKVAESNSNAAWVGYTLGGMVGSIIALWVTKKVFKDDVKHG